MTVSCSMAKLNNIFSKKLTLSDFFFLKSSLIFLSPLLKSSELSVKHPSPHLCSSPVLVNVSEVSFLYLFISFLTAVYGLAHALITFHYGLLIVFKLVFLPPVSHHIHPSSCCQRNPPEAQVRSCHVL